MAAVFELADHRPLLTEAGGVTAANPGRGSGGGRQPRDRSGVRLRCRLDLGDRDRNRARLRCAITTRLDVQTLGATVVRLLCIHPRTAVGARKVESHNAHLCGTKHAPPLGALELATCASAARWRSSVTATASADLSEGGERALSCVGQRSEVLLCCGDLTVAQPLLNDDDVRAAGQQPGRVRCP